MTASLTVFQGRAADRNDLAIAGARSLGDELGRRLAATPVLVGRPEPALGARWDVELAAALPALRTLHDHFDRLYAAGLSSVAATSRCAVSLATLPPVVKHRPDACIVWFDAHGDLNTPASSTSGYLGGLVLSAAMGLWDSGLGSGLTPARLVLVGQRDLDPFEVDLIRTLGIAHVAAGPHLANDLSAAMAGRPAYVHIDCDVLDPGIVPTEYACEGGLGLDDLRAASEAIAAVDVVGLELAEFQDAWTRGAQPVSPRPLLDAVQPLLDRMARP